MKNNFVKALFYLLLFLILILIHFGAMKFVFGFEGNLLPVYGFTFSICAVALFFMAAANTVFHKQLGFFYIGVISLKLLSAIVFMKNFKPIGEPEFKFSFIILYLISIVLITIFTARLLLYPKK